VEEHQRDQAGMLALLPVRKNKPTWKVAWVVLERKTERAMNAVKVFLSISFSLSLYKLLILFFFVEEKRQSSCS